MDRRTLMMMMMIVREELELCDATQFYMHRLNWLCVGV